ncbi:hypothetical protein [Oceanithermus profundus]|uniref:hypothetical protein n=1 Tax=Oceanithermus profundus TaxID=187137 RepID=UPI001FDED084|nr:hypothetical protein [Oceanithermus profundus]
MQTERPKTKYRKYGTEMLRISLCQQNNAIKSKLMLRIEPLALPAALKLLQVVLMSKTA